MHSSRPAQFSRCLCFRALLTVAALVAGAGTAADAAVRIELADGRQITADAATLSADGKWLELRSSRAGISIERRIAVQQIQAMTGGDRPAGALVRTSALRREEGEPFAEPAPLPTPVEPPTAPPYVPPASIPLPDAALPRFEPPMLAPNVCRWGLDARVLGVRADPLSAYAGEVAHHFPHGVPLSEAGFVRDLMRARKAQEVLGPIPPAGLVPPAVPFLPGAPAPAPFPVPSAAPARLEARAFPMNHQGRLDWDTLAVDLAAFDLLDRPVPLAGTVRLTLWGQSQRLVRAYGERLIADAGDVETIGTWTRAIDSRHGRRAPVRVLVPLPRPLPDHDRTQAPWGELHVQIAVPGHGTVETTVPGVKLQHVSPLRNRRLVESGTRFFPGEATTDSPRPGSLFRRATSLRPNGRVLSVQP